MNRRRFMLCLTLCSMLSVTRPLGGVAAPLGPTYTVKFADRTLRVRVEESRTPDGGRVVRVQSRPQNAAKSDFLVDTSVVLEASGEPASSRVFFGIDPAFGLCLEAIRMPGGYKVQEPALGGDLPFGAPLFSPLVAELFIGRQYDFKRGGPQRFAHLLDYHVSTAKILPLTLTAEGKPEMLNLPDGPVRARKLRYDLDEPLLPKEWRTGVFYVGPSGEVLKCETAFFGVPLQARGPALWENKGRRLALRFANPDSGGRVVLLRADKQVGGDWVIHLEFEKEGGALATLSCDRNYRLKRIETPWRGRKFVGTVTGESLVRWTLAAGNSDEAPVPQNSPVWFLPHWFRTDLWEGTRGAFADLDVAQTRDGHYFPLFTGQRTANAFTLERLPDAVAARANGATSAVRNYRFYSGGKTAEGTVPKDAEGRPLTTRYDLYTDGTSLLAFLGSDGIRIVRDGWEAFADGLTPPAGATASPPKP
ncbi:MAG: hypothetical protein H7Z41_19865 [Cytophagales bacterium]|nr:hypothetical protein [Armatimonadota bacterium]